MRLLLILIVLLLLVGVYPAWPYNSGWGYAPFSGLGLVVVVLLIIVLLRGGL